jgi:murein DD-endopeptidase MepM/ murein hydrolase activator NlpD
MKKIRLQAGLYEGKELGYSQLFGGNAHWYKPFGLIGHNGIDIPTPVGTRLLSCINGKVSETANDPKGYGVYVKIENEECGVLYAHLKDFHLKVGDKVKAGDFVGFAGNTGNSTGPHLHFGVHPIPRDRSNGYAGYIDPFGNQIEWVTSLNEDVKPSLSIKKEEVEEVSVIEEKPVKNNPSVNNTINSATVAPKVEDKKEVRPIIDLKALDGNKTKLITIATVVVGALYSQGYIDEKLFSTIDVIVSALIGFTLRDAIKKK